ncbi:MAG: hypothetical protein QM401_00740 [Bacillota bacterium]|nr:hypothetical protein [Bacillota bacterium]
MSYNLEQRSKKYGEEINIFDSQKIRWVTGGVTLDHTLIQPDTEGRKELKIGTPIGKITATGKYGPYQPGVLGVAASGKTTVDTTEITVNGDKDPAYNGVTIKFAGGGTATEETKVWDGKVLTITLADATGYTHTAVNTLIAAATEGAPSGVNPSEIAIATSVTSKNGSVWAEAEPVVLAGGVKGVAAASDGRQTAVLMLGETVDFSLGDGYGFGDQVATAFDWARVLTARLPVTVTAELKQQLNNITFV